MKIIAMIPTYNEAGNIKEVIENILSLDKNFEVLVVDDMSPDKTYEIVEKLGQSEPRIHLLLRKEKRGRGYAGKDGFKKALELGADFVVEMDGDGSHAPKYIPQFLQAAEGYEVIIGSRYVKGGKDDKRNFLRKAVSNFARNYLAFAIGAKVKDPTSGFRMFKRDALKSFVDKLKASDPFIVTEVLYYVNKGGFKVKEYPIEFLPRISGVSKLKPLTLVKYLFKVLKLRFS
ncbi:MAG: polyprenol monophosphomannose synthase [Elusimicrobiota bacterium]|jgi:dolichol-phosphate mannosyltransferase|nr:polyprenol monophosphomannose synthase [Elusimicrobiota bacterium]